MRIENSLITSLSELRAIEQQRVADEHAAVERDRLAKIEAARAEAQAKIDAEQARIRADREARMRIETARAEAEREARLRVEAAEAAERARLQAQLEERRMVEELAIKRAEVAKKRPTWMLVVTSIAAIAATGLLLFAIDRSRDMERAEEQQRLALIEKEKAKQELREYQERMNELRLEVEKFDDQVAGLQKQLEDAQTQADRKRVAQEIAAANEAKRELERKMAAERAARERAERIERVDVSKCTDTALGCLEHK
jgi:hypothetical protein